MIDLRWVRPLDLATVRSSVEKTRRLVVAEEQVHAGGWGATVISELAQAGVAFAAPPRRVSLPDDYPIPYTPPLEDLVVPSVDSITAAAPARRRTMTETAARPVEAPRGFGRGALVIERVETITPGAARAPLHRQRVQHGQPSRARRTVRRSPSTAMFQEPLRLAARKKTVDNRT